MLLIQMLKFFLLHVAVVDVVIVAVLHSGFHLFLLKLRCKKVKQWIQRP